MRRIRVQVQYACGRADFPAPYLFTRWVQNAAQHLPGSGTLEVTVRIVGARESAELNRRYRQRQGPTNVLSFSYDVPPGVGLPLLADIVLCAPCTIEEADALGIAPEAHWAHLVVHGTLHVLGLDHDDPAEAATMEGLEGEILTQLGYPHP